VWIEKKKGINNFDSPLPVAELRSVEYRSIVVQEAGSFQFKVSIDWEKWSSEGAEPHRQARSQATEALARNPAGLCLKDWERVMLGPSFCSNMP
jgi:hypothetical protein